MCGRAHVGQSKNLLNTDTSAVWPLSLAISGCRRFLNIADVGFVPGGRQGCAEGWQNITVLLPIPERFGGYCLVLDLDNHGRQFITLCVRTFKADAQRVRFPKLGMATSPTPMCCIGPGAVYSLWRWRSRPLPTPASRKRYAQHAEHLKQYYDANVSVIIEFGGGALRHGEPVR